MEETVTSVNDRRKDVDRMFWILLVAGLLLFGMVTIPPGARKARALRQDLEKAQAVCAQLEKLNETLSQRERALQSDPFYNEVVLRSKMKYTKPGEKEIQTTPPGQSVALVDTPPIKPYTPSRLPESELTERITSWALLVTSAVLVAAAFIFFDQPGRPSAPSGRPSQV